MKIFRSRFFYCYRKSVWAILVRTTIVVSDIFTKHQSKQIGRGLVAELTLTYSYLLGIPQKFGTYESIQTAPRRGNR